jgi:hypothetical protein
MLVIKVVGKVVDAPEDQFNWKESTVGRDR